MFLNTIGRPYVTEKLTTRIANFIHRYKLEHMTVYDLRQSFATLNSEKGKDKGVLRELIGQTEFETTDFYYVYISEERKKKEYERIHGVCEDKNKSKTQLTPQKDFI